MKKAFTIIELLVAMALLAMLIAISGMVFSYAVKAHRAAEATAEITTKLRAFTHQLDMDFGGGRLEKDGEMLFVSVLEPEYATKGGQFIDINTTVDGVITSTSPDGKIGPDIVDDNEDKIPDRYLAYDRIMFFTTGDFQSYDEQPTDEDSDEVADDSERIYSDEARVCYSFGKDVDGVLASQEPNPSRRMLCRTQHLISADATLMTFPDVSSWDETAANNFNTENFEYEYQTVTKDEWLAMTDITSGNWQAKIDMLFYILFDTPYGIDVTGDSTADYNSSSWCTANSSELKVDTSDASTLHLLFMQGVGSFHVQKWKYDSTLYRYRWWPEIDPDGDGIYNETTGGTDYTLSTSNSDIIDTTSLLSQWYPLFGTFDDTIGPALKFTFTLYDSRGVFPEGKTFSYIVYLE